MRSPRKPTKTITRKRRAARLARPLLVAGALLVAGCDTGVHGVLPSQPQDLSGSVTDMGLPARGDGG